MTSTMNKPTSYAKITPLFERAMLISLSISKWAARKHDKEVSMEVALTHNLSDVNLGAYRKQLIDKEALKTINALDSRMREVLYKYTLPGRVDGERILTNILFKKCMEELRALKDERELEVKLFIAKFETFKEEQKIKLNGLYRDDDYPTIEELRDKFDVVIKIDPMPDAADFKVAGIVDAEVAKIESERSARMDAMVNNAMRGAFGRLHEVANKMVTSLTNFEVTEKGKHVHTFRDSLVSNIADVVALLPGLNLTNDETLNRFAEEAQAKLASLSAEDLRNNTELRENTLATAQEIADNISEHMSNFI